MASTGARRGTGAGGRPGGGRPGGGRQSRPARPTGPSTTQAAETVTALVSAPLAAAGFDLEDVRVTRAGSRYVVAVAVDRDGGLDLDAVATASRMVSDVLDAADAELPAALRDAYTLEVSSRGATAPLLLPRHWRRAMGRLVEVRRRGGLGEVTGRITGVDDEVATLDIDGAALEVPFEMVARAVVQLEFRRPPGVSGLDDPDDDTDADDDTDEIDTDEIDTDEIDTDEIDTDEIDTDEIDTDEDDIEDEEDLS